MAQYKHRQFLQHNEGATFDQLLRAGQLAPYSGIYRCNGCGHEVVSEVGRELPPEDHHQHPNKYLKILWQIVVLPN